MATVPKKYHANADVYTHRGYTVCKDNNAVTLLLLMSNDLENLQQLKNHHPEEGGDASSQPQPGRETAPGYTWPTLMG